MSILTARIQTYMDRYHTAQLAKAATTGALHEHTHAGRRWRIVLSPRGTRAVQWRLYDDRPRRVAIGEAPIIGAPFYDGTDRAKAVALRLARIEAVRRATP